MTIELKPEQQQTIDLAIRSGACPDPADVLDQAFESSGNSFIAKTG
jgi:hypothetical protein